MKGWLSKNDLVSFHFFTVNQERGGSFFSSALTFDVHIYICSDRWMCVCANTDSGAPEGECFSHFCNISACVRASGFKQNSSRRSQASGVISLWRSSLIQKETRQIGMEMESAVSVPNVQTDWLPSASHHIQSLSSPSFFPVAAPAYQYQEKQATLKRACLMIEMSNSTSMKRKHESSCW